MIELVRQAIASGKLKLLDPSGITVFVEEGVVPVILQRLNEVHSPPADADIDWIVDLIMHGVSPPC